MKRKKKKGVKTTTFTRTIQIQFIISNIERKEGNVM